MMNRNHISIKWRHARLALIMAVMLVAAGGCNSAMGPLHEAAVTGNLEFVQSWIAQGRDLDATFDEPSTGLEGNYARARGVTALMMAARAGRHEIVRLLVEGGADLYLESHWRDGSNPRNAFDYAAEYAARTSGRVETVEYLWRVSDGVRFAMRLDEHIITSCIRACNDLHGEDARSNLALFLIGIASGEQRGKGISEAACYSLQPLELLGFLDRHGVQFPGNTLHCSVYFPHVKSVHSVDARMAMASFFIDRGADLENRGAGHTPLTGAAATHDIDMVKFLLARGANPNARNGSGITAIGLAANICVTGGSEEALERRQGPQLAVIEYLARAGADASLYASQSELSKLQILSSCCSRIPHTGTQRRICDVFGL